MTNNIVGLAIFAIGIVLLIFGFNATQAVGPEVARLFTGNPADHSIWLVIGGAVAVIGGLILAASGVRKS